MLFIDTNIIQLFELIGTETVDDLTAVAAPDRKFAAGLHLKGLAVCGADLIHIQENASVAFQKTAVAFQLFTDCPEGGPVPAVLTIPGLDHDIFILGNDISDVGCSDPDQPFTRVLKPWSF